MGGGRNQTEDEVREQAAQILGIGAYASSDDTARSGVGQITSFKKLGFNCEGNGNSHKPDGWYIPINQQDVAIILETKSSDKDLGNKRWVDELLKNIRFVNTAKNTPYKKVVGILYNGHDVRVFKNDEDITEDVADTLQHHSYYTKLFTQQAIDKNRIYLLTKRINDLLKSEFGIKDLKHRMIFTACALVAKRYNAMFVEGMDYSFFHNAIHSTLRKELINSKQQNHKLGLLVEVFSEIKMNLNVDDEDEKQQRHVKEVIGEFVGWIDEISGCLNSDAWRGEDVMGIFFNEFSRYKGKSEQGQVFTPEHITNFMYRVLDVSKEDRVLDAACGSGGFLVKAMSNMIQEAGGEGTQEAKDIKANQLFGIEFDREIYALVCANMLLHKDGKTNLEQMDSKTESACEWIRAQHITKVMMNPPFEDKFGCMEIVLNVLNNVEKGTKCGFILPDMKLVKCKKKYLKQLKKQHRLISITKLPEKLFTTVNQPTAMFVFEAGTPQNDKQIFACYMEDDGLERVKNEGRHDLFDRWDAIEDYWVDVLDHYRDEKYHTEQWIHPDDELCYQTELEIEPLAMSDFYTAAQNYIYYSQGIDEETFKNRLITAILEADVDNIVKDEGRIEITVFDEDDESEDSNEK